MGVAADWIFISQYDKWCVISVYLSTVLYDLRTACRLSCQLIDRIGGNLYLKILITAVCPLSLWNEHLSKTHIWSKMINKQLNMCFRSSSINGKKTRLSAKCTFLLNHSYLYSLRLIYAATLILIWVFSTVDKKKCEIHCCDSLLVLPLPSLDDFNIIYSTNHFVLTVTNASEFLQLWLLRKLKFFFYFLFSVSVHILSSLLSRKDRSNQRHERRPWLLLSEGPLYRCTWLNCCSKSKQFSK